MKKVEKNKVTEEQLAKVKEQQTSMANGGPCV